jgi:hypothetical protein
MALDFWWRGRPGMHWLTHSKIAFVVTMGMVWVLVGQLLIDTPWRWSRLVVGLGFGVSSLALRKWSELAQTPLRPARDRDRRPPIRRTR